MTENQMEQNETKIGPIGERLERIIKHYRLNMNSISIQLGLPSNSVITRIVRDPERGMSLELIQKILLEFREINPDWFVTGRGEMFIEKRTEVPEVKSDVSLLVQKDETIESLRMVIKSKDEVIAAKEDLIVNLRKQNNS